MILARCRIRMKGILKKSAVKKNVLYVFLYLFDGNRDDIMRHDNCIVSCKAGMITRRKLNMKTKKHDTNWMVSVALMAAIVIVLANTPLGMIQLPIIKATTVHFTRSGSRGNFRRCIWNLFADQ